MYSRRLYGFILWEAPLEITSSLSLVTLSHEGKEAQRLLHVLLSITEIVDARTGTRDQVLTPSLRLFQQIPCFFIDGSTLENVLTPRPP